jgi:DNA polymerase-3 subunit epsilon
VSTFTAIDFETADRGRDSACAVAAVLVEDGQVVDRYYQLIQPPRRDFVFTYIHGLTWDDVRDGPTFPEMWADFEAILDRGDFLVAHNAPFDRGVLYGCCEVSDIQPPAHEFVCTVRLARRTWNLPSARLPAVCKHLGIPLNHHNALSDAEACAEIAIRGFELMDGP